ncbi:MAG: MarR family winged helix-turn-helix transcriptional regulator [Alteraurantiacibacter sp.]
MDLKRIGLEGGLRLIVRIANHLLGEPQPNRNTTALDAYLIESADRVHGDNVLTALAEYTGRHRRQRHLPEFLFAEPAWNMLLDLYLQQADDRAVPITGACIASLAPPTTALRWISIMKDEGLVDERADIADGRRRFLRLTRHGRRQLEAYLSERTQFDRTGVWPSETNCRSGDFVREGNS